VKVERFSVMVPCPECENEIYLGYALGEGEKIICPICWAYLVVTDLDPMELNWDIEAYEDDWGWDEDPADD